MTTSSKESRLKENLATDALAELTEEEVIAITRSAGGVHHRFFVSCVLLFFAGNTFVIYLILTFLFQSTGVVPTHGRRIVRS